MWLFVLGSYAVSLGDVGVEPIVRSFPIMLVFQGAIEQVNCCFQDLFPKCYR